MNTQYIYGNIDIYKRSNTYIYQNYSIIRFWWYIFILVRVCAIIGRSIFGFLFLFFFYTDKYSNSVLAFDIENKKLLWEFQEIEHDIWNYDIASPPILTSIKVKEKLIDVVVVPTKFGNTLVLDRLSGANIFGYIILYEIPSSNQITGGLIVISSCLLITYREMKKKIIFQ